MTHELIIVSVFELDDMISMWMVYLQPSKFEQMIMVTHSKKKKKGGTKNRMLSYLQLCFPSFLCLLPTSLHTKTMGVYFHG